MIMGIAPQLPLFTVIQLMFVEMDPGDCNNCLCNLLLRLVVSVGSFVRPCVRACVRTCEKRKRKPHARAPGCTFDL